MKILTKQEISTLKGTERKMEIDEGVKLAKRVDALRELSSKEQVNLSKFRDESLANIKKDIDLHIIELNHLLDEIREAEEQRNKLREPLDEEWSHLHAERRVFEKNKAELIEVDYQLSLRQTSIREKESKLKIDIERLDDERNKVAVISVEAQLLMAEAKENSSRMQTVMRNTNNESTEIMKSVSLREKEVEIRESDALMKERHNQKVATENDLEARRLKDMRETLERAINRTKHDKRV